jgi:hypothetical protein
MRFDLVPSTIRFAASTPNPPVESTHPIDVFYNYAVKRYGQRWVDSMTPIPPPGIAPVKELDFFLANVPLVFD